MDFETFFKDSSDNKPGRVALISFNTESRVLAYPVAVKNGKLTILNNENDSSIDPRFVGLTIDLATMKYEPLQKIAVGHRFFSFEGIRSVEITMNEYEGGVKLVRAFTFEFQVDQLRYKLVNIRPTALYASIYNVTAWWQDEKINVSTEDLTLLDRSCTVTKYLEIVSKIESGKVQSFC